MVLNISNLVLKIFSKFNVVQIPSFEIRLQVGYQTLEHNTRQNTVESVEVYAHLNEMTKALRHFIKQGFLIE